MGNKISLPFRYSQSDEESGDDTGIDQRLRELEASFTENLRLLQTSQAEVADLIARVESMQVANGQAIWSGIFQAVGLGDNMAIAGQGAGCFLSNVSFHKLREYPSGIGWEENLRRAGWYALFGCLAVNTVRTVWKIARTNGARLERVQMCVMILGSFIFAAEPVLNLINKLL